MTLSGSVTVASIEWTQPPEPQEPDTQQVFKPVTSSAELNKVWQAVQGNLQRALDQQTGLSEVPLGIQPGESGFPRDVSEAEAALLNQQAMQQIQQEQLLALQSMQLQQAQALAQQAQDAQWQAMQQQLYAQHQAQQAQRGMLGGAFGQALGGAAGLLAKVAPGPPQGLGSLLPITHCERQEEAGPVPEGRDMSQERERAPEKKGWVGTLRALWNIDGGNPK